MTLATYNVNFAVWEDPATVAAIAALPADVVFLQETNPDWERALRPHVTRFAHVTFHHDGKAGGVATLSTLPIRDAAIIERAEDGWFPAWRGTLETPLGDVQVLNVHLRPNVSDDGSVLQGLFTTGTVRRAELEHFVATVDEQLPLVVVGDFNEGQAGSALGMLGERGFASALAAMGSEDHTWRWRTRLGELRYQVDHIVFSPALEITQANVARVGNSDHYPVLATLRPRIAGRAAPLPRIAPPPAPPAPPRPAPPPAQVAAEDTPPAGASRRHCFWIAGPTLSGNRRFCAGSLEDCEELLRETHAAWRPCSQSVTKLRCRYSSYDSTCQPTDEYYE